MRAPVSSRELGAACEEAARIARVCRSVRDRLAREHITTVLSEVVGPEPTLGPGQLARLGFPADIAACFPDLSSPQRFCYRPAISGFRLRPESLGHPLARVRLNLPSGTESVSIGLRLLRDLLAAADDVEICLLARPGTRSAQMSGLIERWGHDPGRVTILEHHCTTLFAQDDGLSGRDDDGRPALLLPRRDDMAPDGPDEELESLTRQLPFPVARSRLHWEGGNLLCDGERCLIGANTIARNRRALGLSEAQVAEAFALEFGCDVLVLGDCAESLRLLGDRSLRAPFLVEGGQADFHLDVDIALLGRAGEGEERLAAVADCALWRVHLDEILAQEALFADHFLPPAEMKEIFAANLAATMERRSGYIEGYRDGLDAAGYRLLALPDVRLSPTYDYLGRTNFRFNYTNVVPARTAAHGPSVFAFRFGIAGLDGRAEEIFGAAGITPVIVNRASPAGANEVFRRHGGVHCLLSKMA